MNRRWVCPRCGSSKNAPERARKNDTRRFCLSCSESTGRLVERECPAAERVRSQRSAQRAARTTRARERAAEQEAARLTVGGVRLDLEAERLWRLQALRDSSHWHQRMLPITWRRGTRQGSSGRCFYGERIVVTAGTDAAFAVETVLHELVHEAVGYEGHSPRFWSTLRAAACEAWPDVDFEYVRMPSARGWQADRWIAEHLRPALGAEASS